MAAGAIPIDATLTGGASTSGQVESAIRTGGSSRGSHGVVLNLGTSDRILFAGAIVLLVIAGFLWLRKKG